MEISFSRQIPKRLVKCNRSADHFLMIFALLLLHFCFGFCGAFVVRLCHSEKPHRCSHFVPILSYPQELKRLIRKGETALLIVCHCEHTEKTLIFVPLFYRFCAFFFRFSSSLSAPMRSKPPKETVIFGSVLAPVWSQLLHTGRCAMVRPAHVPRHYSSHREEGRFLTRF